MNSDKYMILAEVKNKGFVLKFMNDESEAREYSQQLFELSHEYPFGEMEPVIEKFDCVASYMANGNQVYTPNCFAGASDGDYSVSILKIDINTFCLKTFIRERENCSTVFDIDELSDEHIELFPSLRMIAN